MIGKPARVALVLVGIAAAVGVTVLVRFQLAPGGPSRTLVVQNISIVYDGPDALAVIVESRRGEKIAPWAYAMLGTSAGRLSLPQPFTAGADAVFRFGLAADIVPAGATAGPTVSPVEFASLRGLSGAHHDQENLAFRGAKDEASIALKPDGPPILLRVTERNGRLQIGDKR